MGPCENREVKTANHNIVNTIRANSLIYYIKL